MNYSSGNFGDHNENFSKTSKFRVYKNEFTLKTRKFHSQRFVSPATVIQFLCSPILLRFNFSICLLYSRLLSTIFSSSSLRYDSRVSSEMVSEMNGLSCEIMLALGLFIVRMLLNFMEYEIFNILIIEMNIILLLTLNITDIPA